MRNDIIVVATKLVLSGVVLRYSPQVLPNVPC